MMIVGACMSVVTTEYKYVTECSTMCGVHGPLCSNGWTEVGERERKRETDRNLPCSAAGLVKGARMFGSLRVSTSRETGRLPVTASPWTASPYLIEHEVVTVVVVA